MMKNQIAIDATMYVIQINGVRNIAEERTEFIEDGE